MSAITATRIAPTSNGAHIVMLQIVPEPEPAYLDIPLFLRRSDRVD